MSEIVSTKSKNIKVDSSRYAIAPRRKASRYAKKSGSRDSRILSRYAANIFDRPPRHSLQLEVFLKSLKLGEGAREQETIINGWNFIIRGCYY
ncbi:hypothetical protein E3N88_23521 [Mikania micrantha]|uniref:Uncharacterized protein n=1 Tax=Mikania micrantha TaxID=192012 RepID=A0A5N6NF55_9ASTR|nr:hypothetical protein E3N88_23521 [Mikania micrantha]